MAVGQYETVRRNHDAGAEPAALARIADFRPGLDAHDGGTDAVGHVDHGVGIGIQQRLVVDGSGFGCGRQADVASVVKSNMAQIPLGQSDGYAQTILQGG